MHSRFLPTFFLKIVFGAFLLTGLIAGIQVRAQTPTYSYVGTSNNLYPLQSSNPNMCQFLFQPGDITPTAPTGVFITTIYLKPSNIGTFTSTTFTNLLIKIGSTTLTTLTSGTWNSGLTTVLSAASYTISPTSTTWIPITLTTPFLYTGSNFIIELSQMGYSGSGLNIAQGTASGARRMYGSASSASSTGADGSLITLGFDTAPANCAGTPLTPLITTAAFPAATPLCAGSTTVINASDPNLPINGMAYQWQSSSTATGPWTNVVGGSGATTLAYTTPPVSTNTYFRIAATCTNSSITSNSNAFLVPVGSPQPGIITGASTYCPGDPEVYSVPAISGGSYTWTLPTGWSGFSTSNSITVTPGPGTTPQTIAVAVTTPCGPISIQRTRSIVPGSAPGPPGTIAGNSHICGGTTQTYTVLPVGGASYYVWTLPTGWSGGSTTNTINVTTNNNSGPITVKAINGCGQSSVNTLTVTVITALANPGTITGKDTVCSGSLQPYSIAPVPGATSYTWTLPSGWSGTTTGTSIQTFAGAATGGLTVTAYVSCATSPVSSKNLTVVTTVNPAVSISAPTTVLCQGTPITITAVPTFPGTAPVYQWKKNGVNVAGFGTSYTNNSLVKGDSISVTLTSNAACAANTTVVSNSLAPNITPSVMPGVSINSVPPIILCKGTSITFTTASNGTGATPSYQWFKNGSMISGANGTTYTDATLTNADTLTIEMTTSALCAIKPVAVSNKVGIVVNPLLTPTVSISVSPSEYLSPGQPVTFTATHNNGGATPDYQWQKNGVNIPFETEDNYTSSTLQPGDHITVKMLSYADCVEAGLVTSNIVVMKSSLGVGGNQTAGSISIYPNPNSGRFTVAATSWDAAYSGKQVRVDVLNAVGQSVYHMELIPTAAKWQTQVSLDNELADGRYILRISTDDGAVRNILPFILTR
jgi:hypothetical protein